MTAIREQGGEALTTIPPRTCEGDVSLLYYQYELRKLIPPLPNKARSHGGKEKEEALLSDPTIKKDGTQEAQ